MKLPATATQGMFTYLNPFGDVKFFTHDMKGQAGYILLEEFELTRDVPQEDPTPRVIQALKDHAEDIQAEASAAVRQIMDQIQSLQCLEHLPEGDA